MKLQYPNFASATLLALGVDSYEGDYKLCGDELTVTGFSDGQIAEAEASINVVALQAREDAAPIYQQIAELEAQQTPRLIREALAGVQFAIDKLAAIDAEISVLRGRLV